MDEILGLKSWDKGVEIVRSTLTNRRTAVKGCVGSSKTFHAAVASLSFLHAFRPSEVYETAPTFRQVKKAFFKEVKRIHRGSKVEWGGEPLDTELKLAPDWFLSGFSSKNPDYIHGIHSPAILLIIDESQGVDEDMMEAAENMMASENAHILLLGNPSSSSGMFHRAFHSDRSRWHTISIAGPETPNWKANKNIFPGMLTRKQGEEWIRVYGKNSPFVQVKVFANFAAGAPDAIIPLEWLELAKVREVKTGTKVLGVDPARFGDDDSVIIEIDGRKVRKPTVVHGYDTMEFAGLVVKHIDKIKAVGAGVDPIGVGSGVLDRLIELDKPAQGVNVSEKPRHPEKYANRRSELWWELRELLDPNHDTPLQLPEDDELIAELSSVRYSHDSAGRVKVESKDDIKKRLGKSPDRADALVIARYMMAIQAPAPSGTVNPDSSPSGGARGHGITRLSDRWGKMRR